MPIKRVSIKSITEVVTKGTTPTSIGYKFVDEGIPFLRVNNIQDGKLIKDDILFIDEKTDAALSRSRIKPNDVLISIAGTIGRTAVVPPDEKELNCNQAVAIIRLLEQVEPHYVNYWLQAEDAARQISGSKVTATISNLSLGCIRELKIPLPPIAEQRRIAAILDKADAVRRKRKEAIALTEELLRSAFLEMFGDPISNPRGWTKKPLKDVADLLTGFPFKSREYVEAEAGIRLCRGANVLPDQLDWKDVCYWRKEELHQFEEFHLNEADIIMALDRPWISSGFKIAKVQPSDLPSLLVQRVARIRAHDQDFQEYLYFLLRHPAFKKHCRPTETTIPHISPKELKNYPVPIPDIQKIGKFNQLCATHSTKMRKLLTQIEAMETLFNSLLQRAFRGDL